MYRKEKFTPEELKERRKIQKHESYLRARKLGKRWASNEKALEYWYEKSKEKRSELQKISNAKHRKKYPNESSESMKKWRETHREEERQRELEKRRENKRKAIEYLGGKCSKCNGLFHPDVYDFHHKNPEEKDICVARLLQRKFERAIPELDKCILVCANCHRIIHAQY